MKRISVIIPAHNAARFLGEALDSVIAQGLEDLEIVVVDDGSSDDTARVARSYGHGVRLLSQPQSGSGRARNVGIRATEGELVAFQDADDLWTEEKSGLQLAVLERDPSLALVFSDMVAFRDGVQETTTYFRQRGFDGRCLPSSIFLYDMVSTPTVILRRSCLDAVGHFDETLPIGQDTDLWFRIALAFPFAVVDRPLVHRRFHATNTTRNNRLLLRCAVEIWGRYLGPCIEREPGMETTLHRFFSRVRWNHLFVEGCSLLREGRPREARRKLREAIGLAPFSPRPYAFYLESYLRSPGLGTGRSA